MCARARACTNKAWHTGARRRWWLWWLVVQQVVHAERQTQLETAVVGGGGVGGGGGGEGVVARLKGLAHRWWIVRARAAVKQTCSEYTDVC